MCVRVYTCICVHIDESTKRTVTKESFVNYRILRILYNLIGNKKLYETINPLHRKGKLEAENQSKNLRQITQSIMLRALTRFVRRDSEIGSFVNDIVRGAT